VTRLAGSELGLTYFARVTLGAGLQIVFAPWFGGCRSSASKVPLARRFITRANGTSCRSGASSGPSLETTWPGLELLPISLTRL
jgi:hypothetical protein